MERITVMRGNRYRARHVQCLLVFFALSIGIILRMNLTMTIEAMTDKSKKDSNNEDSFLWGYIVTQVPGGYLAQRFGAKFVLFTAMAVCSLITIMTPWITMLWGWKLLITSRILQGLCQGALLPTCHTLLSKWCPKEERGVLATFAYSGDAFGMIVTLATNGFLTTNFGWQSIFYSSGVVGLIWSGVWLLLGSSTPANSNLISAEERHFIDSSLGKMHNDRSREMSTPWNRFFKSPPFLALIFVHCANNWGYWTLLTQTPRYMEGVLGVNIKSNALLLSLPYIAMLVMALLFVVLATILYNKSWLSLEMERKLFNTIGHWISMVILGVLGIALSEVTLVVVLLTVAVGFNSAIYLGFYVNHIDLAPNHSGTLIGITNGLGNVLILLAPLIVDCIVTNEHDPSQWRIVFFIAAGFYFIGSMVFLIFGTTKKQSWDDPDISQSQKENVEELNAIRTAHDIFVL